MSLNEAEIQVLASLKEAEITGQPADRQTLERRGKRYQSYKEDWFLAFSSLIAKGLLRGADACFALTAAGQPLAELYHAERANESWYHYERFYPIAHQSAAHSQFCERVYGRDLCQDGQTDMHCFNDMIERLHLKPGDHVLDVGCGAGGLAEYLSDRTGARVTGIDNSASGIATALARTAAKRAKLTFTRADINALDLPTGAFDAAISLDSIYWATDLRKTLSAITTSLKPGGQLCVLMEQRMREGDRPEVLEVDKTAVALALEALNLNYGSADYTASFLKFWPLARRTAEALREDFARDGAEFIYETWARFADDVFLPALEANRIRRFLYHIHT